MWTSRTAAASTSPNEKLNVAFIGTDGQANSHLDTISSLAHNCPCFCDVDTNRMARAAKLWPKAARYQDYRRMFDERQREIDAVFVTTPDHHHFPASMIAIQLGKHVYCEKPLTHSIWEARQLRLAAQRNKVATQMGITGHARPKWRELITLARAGHLGAVREVHVWSDRPIWPQGVERPAGTSVPGNLDWDVWLGPGPERPYNAAYHPFNWRGWADFGTGGWATGLPPARRHVLAAGSGPADDSRTRGIERNQRRLISQANDRSLGVSGKGRTSRVSSSLVRRRIAAAAPVGWERGQQLHKLGCYFVGEKGTILTGHGEEIPMIVLDEGGKGDIRLPDELAIPPSPGHHQEFIAACQGGPPAGANFDYAGPMTEAILLGNLALRLGKPIHWDAVNLAVKNSPEAGESIRRQYRKGWEV